MNVQKLQSLSKVFLLPRRNSPHSLFYSQSAEISEIELPPSFAEDGGEPSEEDKVRRRKSLTNKSRLQPHHRKILMEERPYDEPVAWHHLTEKYQRQIFGRYGLASKIDPRICFPTQEDIKNREEYEKIAYPYTLQEMMEKVKLENEAKRLAIKKREDEITKKLEKLEQWKHDLHAKIAKKEADAIAARERKERLVEEVRRHFGFKIDPRDERFKELLEQKEKEDRKKQKEVKRKAKEEKMMAKLMGKAATEKQISEKQDAPKTEPE